jgi:hypothetical protein
MLTNILIIVLAVILGHLDYQFYKAYTEPRLYHDKLKMDEIYANWREITKQKNEN